MTNVAASSRFVVEAMSM